MNEYLITVELPADLSEEFIALIPAHRHRVNELMQEGIITSYSLAADRRRLWTTLIASGEEDVVKTLMTLPLYRFMQFEVRELMFHNIPVFAAPRFSVN